MIVRTDSPGVDDVRDGIEQGRSTVGRLAAFVLHAGGALLILLVVLPLYSLLDQPGAGPFPLGAVAAAELSRSLLFLGSVIIVVLAIFASRLVDAAALERAVARVGTTLVNVPTARFACSLALIAGLITLGFSHQVLHGKPNLVDAMVQLLHARYLADGHLGGPPDLFPEFWQIQNSLVTPNGWVSQYPPGYVAFLAAGLRLGVVILIGPLLAGVAVLFTALAAERLLPDDRVTARVGSVMLCFSPFVIGLAGAFMNHIGAAAFTVVAVYFATRSRDGAGFSWAILAGLAVGVVFSIRPLSAVVAALVVAIIWLTRASSVRILATGFAVRTLGAIIGIAPILILIGAYNQHFFGNPFTFGYVASQGPLVGLGFHRDPTGVMYGPVQALAYTSSDLTTLSLYLLETPLPAVVVVGLFLLFAKRVSAGTRVIVAWALLPVLANAFYWHHGIFMGPRMLNEAAPQWILLTAISAIGLVRMISRDRTIGNYSPRGAATLIFGMAWLTGLVYMGPQRLVSYGGPWMESSRLELPPPDRPSLVFVHGAWAGRVSMRLLAHGMRVDSLEAAMRQNSTCESHNYALWYSTPPGQRAPAAPPLDFSIVPHDMPPHLQVSAGNEIRVRKGERLSRDCLREVASDTLGIVDVAPLVWQGDLPVEDGTGAMYVRDYGPEANARLIARYPERVPKVFLRPGDRYAPKLLPYAEGMKLLWPTG